MFESATDYFPDAIRTTLLREFEVSSKRSGDERPVLGVVYPCDPGRCDLQLDRNAGAEMIVYAAEGQVA